MYELIEHQKRFKLENEDEALLEWLTKVDEQKRIERQKKADKLEAERQEKLRQEELALEETRKK